MTFLRLTRGKRGEDEAERKLKSSGYRIITRNFRCPLGEIDIIAEKKGALVFVEVKTKTSLKFGLPQENVTRYKQSKIKKIAQWYLATTQQFHRDVSFCVVAVQLDKEGNLVKIEMIEDAF